MTTQIGVRVIYLIRHGQTVLNKAGALQGRSDQPLNEVGIAQAQAAAAKLAERGVSFEHVYASPLRRAIQTAQIVAPDLPVQVDERLIEMDYGPYEGADLNNLPPEVLTFFQDFVHNPAPDGMEQLADVVARTGAFVESIAGLVGDVLVSTHAIAMKGILEYLTPTSGGSYWSKHLGNCEVYTVANGRGLLDVPRPLFA